MDDLRAVDADDVATVSRTLARAFVNDPVFKVLFGESVPVEPTSDFFAVMAALQLEHGHVYQTAGAEAAAVWAPPDTWKIPLRTIIRNGPRLLRVFGRRTIGNLGVLTQMENVHPTEPHYYLEFIGTDPEHQGKGLGAKLMQPMMERCDTEGVGCYLESSNEQNLSFYHRFGFIQRPLIALKAGPTLYPMWRDPR